MTTLCLRDPEKIHSYGNVLVFVTCKIVRDACLHLDSINYYSSYLAREHAYSNTHKRRRQCAAICVLLYARLYSLEARYFIF